MAINRNLEKGLIYVNRWWTGEYSQRSPLFTPMSAMGIQVLQRQDTLWDGLNTEISHNSTVQRRYGFSKYCSAQLGANDHSLAYYGFRNTSGTIKAVVDTPTKVSWFNTTTLNTIFSKTSTAQMSFTKVGNTLYMCNGTDLDCRKWDGTTASGWGIVSPATAPTLSFGAGTLSPLTGYTYVYVYKNSATGHISSASPYSAPTGPLTSQAITVHGASSTDPQVDKIDIYRIYDGGSQYYYLTTIDNGGSWTYTDNIADSGLNDFFIAPLAHVNDPPPSGASLVKWYAGRLWVTVGNAIYYSGGASITNGVPEECFPPANNFIVPGQITAIVALSVGLVLFTHDSSWIIYGDGVTSGFGTPQLWQDNFGVSSQNCVCQDGDLLFLYTSQGRCFSISSGGLEEIGFPIQAKLTAVFDPTKTYLTLHRSGTDEGLFLSNGSTSVRRYSISMSCWSPVAQPVGGINCISSIEVAPNDYRMMMGRTAGSGYVLSRDTTSFADDGVTYSANVVVGSLILAPPRQVAILESVVLETTAVGTYPTLQVLLNEISGNFTTLPNPVPDPPQLIPSTTVRMMRHDIKTGQIPLPQHVRHCQIKIVWAAEATQGELLGMALI